jgi:CDP-6-deoxy-D-xylo-4-hexulose-3-dehydrase
MSSTYKFPLMRNNITRTDLDSLISYLQQPEPMLTNGKKVRDFESAWSEWLGVTSSTFVNSGASANLISMSILKQMFPNGGEVIVPTITWVSDIASVLQCGFTPRFVDVTLPTIAMGTEQILQNLNSNTRAVFITHAQGFDALTDELVDELRKRNILLIEDVCESHGAMHNDRRLGSIGQISNFSFYYAHHMSTIEGGMVCTNDPEIHQLARMFRSHGMVRELTNEQMKDDYQIEYPDLNPDFIFAIPGFNMRGTEIGGVLGLSQIERLDSNVVRRNQNHELFLSEIDRNRFFTEFKLDGSSNYAFNLIIRDPDVGFRDRLVAHMRKNGIEHRRGSAGGGNQLRQPYLKDIVPSGEHEKFPVAEHIHFFGFYLGNYPELSLTDVSKVCDILNDCE